MSLTVIYISLQTDRLSSHTLVTVNNASDNLTTLPHFNNQKPAAVSTYAQINNKPVKFLSKFQAVAKRKINKKLFWNYFFCVKQYTEITTVQLCSVVCRVGQKVS